MDELLEIRKLPPSAVQELAVILDHADKWKELMGIIPTELAKDNFNIDITDTKPAKYNSEHIQIIDKGAKQYQKSPTAILFDEWGTSGRNRPRLGHLLNLLIKADLFRAADYISVTLLKRDPVPRPKHGPASTVRLQWSDLQHLTEIQNDFNVPILYRKRHGRGIILPNKTDHRLDISNKHYEINPQLRRYRSLESILRDIEQPLSENEPIFYIDSDSESEEYDQYNKEPNYFDGQQRNIIHEESFYNTESTDENAEKNSKGNKGKWSFSKIKKLLNNKISTKDTSDLIIFSSTSSFNSKVSSQQIDDKKKQKDYSMKGQATIKKKSNGIPSLSKLLHKNSLSSSTRNTSKLKISGKKSISSKHVPENIPNDQESVCQICQDTLPAVAAIVADLKEECVCPNIPAFSKIFTDPVLSKLGEQKSRNFVVTTSDKMMRRNTL